MHGTYSQFTQRASSWICNSCQLRLARGQKASRGFATSVTRPGLNSAASATAATANSTRRPKVPDAPARTRFAPSPTGNLHLGSIRTALFNYLLAKRTGGQFLLRIEDTDQKRTIPGAEDRLFRDLQWAGLQWDEGPMVGGPYGPYRQSERLSLYQQQVASLLSNQSAYRCFCSSERIDSLNRMRHEKGLPLGYDRKCKDIPVHQAEDRAARGESHVIRFQVPKIYPKYDDLVYGKSGHGDKRTNQYLADEPVYDDPILIKSDGFPTYHFANVVDDNHMRITHVIRGSEWISSTPLHVALYQAFGWSPPQYGHVSLLVDQNRQKLSKRNFDSDIASFRDRQAIFPETLTNFAALLGWSHQQKTDVMDLSELESLFDLKITKGNTIVSFEKLIFLQEKHAQRRVDARGEPFEQMIRDVALELLNLYGAATISTFTGKRKLRDVVALMLHLESIPYHNPKQFAESLKTFISDEALKTRPPLQQVISDHSFYPQLRIAASTLLLIPNDHWKKEVLLDHLNQMYFHTEDEVEEPVSKQRKHAMRQIWSFLRWALLGGTQGPHIPATMELLGRDVCVTRIQEAVLMVNLAERQTTTPDIKVASYTGNRNEGDERWQSHSLAPSTPSSVAP